MDVQFEPEKLLLFTNTLFDSLDESGLQPAESAEILTIVLEEATGEEELALLDKILSATGIEKERFTTLSLKKASELLPQIQRIRPEMIIIFGLEPSPSIMSLSSQLYQAFEYNGYKILMSQSLRLLKTDANAKKQLWEGLQKFLAL